jgi:hypothetical protein
VTISEKDMKLLWGLAAGKCSEPTCGHDCIQFVKPGGPMILGEMAHVIAKGAMGPRGKPGGGEDSYDNLILLCPTHHTLVDKASGNFPVDTLQGWKSAHEANVRRALSAPHFDSKKTLCGAVLRLLIENHAVWKTYGPESDEAKRNPASSAASLWTLRKLSEVIPNNRRIVNMVKGHSALFDPAEYTECCSFVEHAEGFEQNTYERREGVPRFPTRFEEVVRHGAQ